MSCRFLRALSASADSAGCPVRIVSADVKDWASATFTGQRHLIRLAAPPTPAREAWFAGLPETEWRVAGRLVAEIAVTAQGDVMTLQALLIDEC